jgi:cell shape-determining protein MreD
MFGEIFPAVDLIVIYYFSTYTTIRSWILFIIGIIIDQIYQVPVGLNSFALITINLILNYASRWFILKDEITNILIFCAYSLLLIGFRYIIFLAKNNYGFEGFSIYFYYLTTIFSYPILRFLIHKPFTALTRYAG